MFLQAVDPWTAFLEWLQTILIPDWNGLILLLPILLILGVVGPGLSLLALYWFYVVGIRPARQGPDHRARDARQPAEHAADGTADLPAKRALLPDARAALPGDGQALRHRR